MPFATDGLQFFPIRIVAFNGKCNVLFHQIRVSHDLNFFPFAGIGCYVFGGERNMHPELLERHDLFKRHKFELLFVTVYRGPNGDVLQGSGAVETELEIVLVVHLDLQRLGDIEIPLTCVKEDIRGFIVIQQIIRIVWVIIRFCQCDRKFIHTFSSFGQRCFVIITTDR